MDKKLYHLFCLTLAAGTIFMASLCRNNPMVLPDVIPGESDSIRKNMKDTLFFFKKYKDFSIAVSETLYAGYYTDYYSRDAALIIHNRKGRTSFKRTEEFFPFWDDGVYETGLKDYFFMSEYNLGNCALCSAWFLLKITADTAFVLGRVNGYEDIDTNGTKEFYYNEAHWMPWQSHAEMDIEKIEIKLVDDSLVFPGRNVFESAD
jgi:hypothetical protein